MKHLTCDHCKKPFNTKKSGYRWTEGDLSGQYCCTACALEDNNLLPVSRARCSHCGQILGNAAIADTLSGDLFCSPKCALRANGVEIIDADT